MELLDWIFLVSVCGYVACTSIKGFQFMRSRGQKPSSDSARSSEHSGMTVNDSLNVLYKSPNSPKMQIIFFHGPHTVNDEYAYRSTWKSGNGSCIWPQTWLVDEFPDAHVYTATYTASAALGITADSRFGIGEKFLSDFMQANIGQIPECSVILVGHCLGCLVIQQLCSSSVRTLNYSGKQRVKVSKFLNSIRGIFYYDKLRDRCPSIMNEAVNIPGSLLLGFFKTLSTASNELNNEFSGLKRLYPKWRIHGLVATGAAQSRVLPSREGEIFDVVRVDHIKICRPKTKADRSFYGLTDLLHGIAKDIKEEGGKAKTLKVNDSLYELYKPSGPTSMQVIFFHGFQLEDYRDAHLSAWKSRDGGSIWPQAWLVEEFPSAHILSVSYTEALAEGSSTTRFMASGDSEMDSRYIKMIGGKLVSDLLAAGVGQQSDCPVVLIGHSFGGLVIKQLCLQVIKQLCLQQVIKQLCLKAHQNFLNNLKGLFFYSTPQRESIFMDSAELFVKESPLLEYVKALSSHTAGLNDDFQRSYSNFSQIAGVGEALPTEKDGKSMIIVPEAASRTGDDFKIVEDGDHISICRPKTSISISFRALTRLLYKISKVQFNIVEDAHHITISRPKEKISIELRALERLIHSKIRTDLVDIHLVDRMKRILETKATLGFVGMGGIGKTTLAMAVFNEAHNEVDGQFGDQFEYTCVVEDVKNVVKNINGEIEDTIGAIQDTMIKQMRHRRIPLERTKGGREFLKQLLSGKSLFLILDDVAEESDLEIVQILWNDIEIHKNSRIIITSRESKVLKNCAQIDAVYPISLFNSVDSETLFVSYAFSDGVPASFETDTYNVVRKCAQKCEGLPLALEIVGKFLHGKLDKVIWDQALQVLDKAEAVVGYDERLWARLQLVYDGLDKEERQMFVDAATKFYKADLAQTKAEWSINMKGYQEKCWQHLVDLSLVWELEDFDDSGQKHRVRIGMHDQLLQFGKNIGATIREIGWGVGDNEEKGTEPHSENCSEGDKQRSIAVKSDMHSTRSHEAHLLAKDRGSFSRSPTMVQPSHKGFLNDSLYELYKPPGPISMQVLFFHGLQLGGDFENAYLSTWKTEENCVWPQKWLPEEFPAAHILCVSYEKMDMYSLAENLMQDLDDQKIGHDYPVVLVGHSVGGLVMKQLCLQARKKGLVNFLRNVKGLFFYSTPHHGIDMNVTAPFVSWGPFLDYVKILSTPEARLHHEFGNLCQEDYISWKIAGVGEGRRTSWGFIVSEASSRYGDLFSILTDETHSTICRPKAKYKSSYTRLTSLLRERYSNFRIPHNIQVVPKSNVGIEIALEEVKTVLTQTNKLGLVGMGGIGKTTLAKALFNDLVHCYDYTCFLSDVKSIQGSIQDAMLKVFYARHGREIEEKERSLRLLFGSQLFLVLDDVDSKKDLQILDYLITNYGVHEKSLFVATSRDVNILRSFGFKPHNVSALSQESSKQLFLKHAFSEGLLPVFPETLIDDIVLKCEGLPLTIKVIGKHLQGGTEEIFKEALRQLDLAENVGDLGEDLWARLKVSYNALHKVEKEMFLDAATIFYNSNLDLAKAAWSIDTEESPHWRWNRLINLSLVKEFEYIDKFSHRCVGIRMHEQLLSLGKKIASTREQTGRRIWDTEKETKRSLTENWSEGVVKDIVALKLIKSAFYIEKDLQEEDSNEGTATQTETHISGRTLNKMEQLRYLLLDEIPIVPTDGATLPSTIVSLQLSGQVFTDVPFNPKYHKRTAVLILSECSQLSDLPAAFNLLSSLRILHISGSPKLQRLPDSLGSLAKLEHLQIDACETLVELPKTLGKLVGLKHLVVSDCKALSALPKSLGSLRTLNRLVVWKCGLRQVPGTLGDLKALEHLVLNCGALIVLPDSLERLQRLQKLVIRDCALRELPKTIGKMGALKYLTIYRCEALSALPCSFGNLRSLQELEIRGCSRLKKLPDTFLQLEKLEHLIYVRHLCGVFPT